VEGKQGDYGAAEGDFARALELLGPDPEPDGLYALLNNRAVARAGQRRYDEAEADLRQALKLKPDQYNAYVSLAQVARLRHDPDEAARQLGRAVEVAQAQAGSG
jgi:tetratricopeptide (TPR) repeat protein